MVVPKQNDFSPTNWFLSTEMTSLQRNDFSPTQWLPSNKMTSLQRKDFSPMKWLLPSRINGLLMASSQQDNSSPSKWLLFSRKVLSPSIVSSQMPSWITPPPLVVTSTIVHCILGTCWTTFVFLSMLKSDICKISSVNCLCWSMDMLKSHCL